MLFSRNDPNLLLDHLLSLDAFVNTLKSFIDD